MLLNTNQRSPSFVCPNLYIVMARTSFLYRGHGAVLDYKVLDTYCVTYLVGN